MKKRKILSLFLSLCLLISLLPTVALAADQTNDGAGIRIVQGDAYDSSTGIFSIKVQAKLPVGTGITTIGVLLSYDNTKLAVVNKNNTTKDVTSDEGTLKNSSAIIKQTLIGLVDGDDSPIEYAITDQAMYKEGSRSAIYTFHANLNPITNKPTTAQTGGNWFDVYEVMFRVTGNPADPATVLNSDSLRIADVAKGDDAVMKGAFPANDIYSIYLTDNSDPARLYVLNRMSGCSATEVTGEKSLMTAPDTGTATYPGSTNTPPLPEYTGTIATPAVKTNKAGTVELDAAVLTPADSTAKIQYGYSKTDDGANITWQDGTTFSGLTVGDTLYFYAKVVETSSYAEKVSAASAAVTVASKTVPTINTVPTASAITYGQKLSNSTLSGGAASVAGSFTWKDGTIAPEVKDSSATEYEVVFTPTDAASYETATCKVKLTVNPKSLSSISIIPIDPQPYTGLEIKPDVTVKDGQPPYGELAESDYSVAYSKNKDVGTADIVISPKVGGNYSFAAGTFHFTIKSADSSITITGNPSKTYDGAAVTDPAVSTVPPSGVTVTYAYYTNEGCTTKTTTANSGAASDGAAPKNAGDYWVKATVAASTNYNAATSDAKKFTISKKDLTNDMITLGTQNTYNGTEQSVQIASVKDGTASLIATQDYTVKSGNKATDVGNNTLVIEGKGNYKGTASAKWSLVAKDIGAASVIITLSPTSYDYTGSAITPDPEVKDGATLEKGTDYTVSYSKNTYVGTATLTVIGKGNYTGTKTANFTITAVDQNPSFTTPVDLAKDGHMLNLRTLVNGAKSDDMTFTIPPATISATLSGDTLTSTGITGVVTINVTIKAKDMNGDGKNEYNAYTGTNAITVNVVDKTSDTTTMKVSQSDITYGGSVSPSVTNKPADTGTVSYTYEGRDGTAYSSSATAPTNVGKYTVKAKCESSAVIYTAEDTFEILPKSISGMTVTLDKTSLKYNGSAQTVNVTVKDGSTALIKGTDYTVTGVTSGTNVGSYTVTVTGKGNYKDTATATWKITQATPTYTAPTSLTAKYGQTLADVNIAATTGWSWMDSTQPVGDASTTPKTFKAKFTPTDTTNYKTVENIDVSVAVGKATALTLADIPVSQKYTVDTEQSKNIGNGGMLTDAGALTYTKGTASKTGSVTVTSWDVDSTGKVTYTLSGGAAGDTATLPVIIGSDNYENSTVNVKITLTAKDDQAALTLTGETTVVYGQTLQLGISGGNGNGAVTYAVTNGTGEATIDATGKLTPTKAGTVTVTATKAADANYNAITSAPVTITITKATPTGEPKYTAITTSGKTLADAGLTTAGSNLSVPGTVKWVDDTGADLPATTTVAANTTYKWLFTPTDTNYTTLTGSIQLWHKSTSSGGGSYYAPTVPDMPMLYRGCTGDAVKTLQEKLNAKGFDSGNVDGIFGAKTYAAATAFQKANGLGVDGIVGKLTWAKLYDATPVNVTPVTTQPMLRTGSRGDAVRKLQELLNAKGYTCGSVDGIFGSKTYAAVLAFQKANGLAADGIVGSLTWGKLV